MAETMKDYEAELEASFKKIEEGDILTGTVVSVDDKEIIVDLKYYAEIRLLYLTVHTTLMEWNIQ